ncbi:hypothetical protein EMPS_07737 [Entomortierella parvispora]|uniref:Peptidase S9 prolyl oligopeptidase catalytic domain-containing protein n=1 Tax=Entomortierella parvispora TaxID=205924 RepID=A0A9P3HER3_9FUNG|nr:hypothetical protein EMPS_07737 [Entomortierella parvispora]
MASVPLHSGPKVAFAMQGDLRNAQTRLSGTPVASTSFLSSATTTTPISIRPVWEILGPFPTGMREQDFGADPLEAFGGFLDLPYDEETKYPSELAPGGYVRWHQAQMDKSGWVPVLYPEIEWSFNQQFLGWGFNQFQAWIRSTFTVPTVDCEQEDGLCSITIQCENVGDFYVDRERLSGDWYGYGLTRHTLRLAPGSAHTLSVRVVHEVRIFGGIQLPPPVKIRCELLLVAPNKEIDFGQDSTSDSLPLVQVVEEGHGGLVVMDAVDGVLAGEFISVALRNVGPHHALVKSVTVIDGSDEFSASLEDPSAAIALYPGTHRPISVRLTKSIGAAKGIGETSDPLRFSLAFTLESRSKHKPNDRSRVMVSTANIRLDSRTWGEPYKYTFRDFDGTIQYAAAIPPSHPQSSTNSAPIIVALHGAGVEVSQSPFWQQEYKQRERSWIVLPTGRSPWGYDWHGASIKNVMSTIRGLRDYLPGVPDALRDVRGMQPDAERILMAGHSNGGQGAWYWVTHFPDLAIAATPAAGYVNIKQYVPYSGWLSRSYTDSYLRGLLEASIIEYDNDVHISNAVGVPILARTGSADDNVPPMNSRKMVRLGQENAHNLSAISLSEIQGEGHWFTGALHDGVMQGFLRMHLKDDVSSNLSTATPAEEVVHPPLPKTFEVNLVNPAGMESRGGILVEQLRIPYRKGTLKVQIIDTVPEGQATTSPPTTAWVIKSTNIRRFKFLDSPALRKRMTGSSVSHLILDGVTFELGDKVGQLSSSELAYGTFLRGAPSHEKKELWQFSASDNWLRTERHRETYGPAIQILEKRVIVVLGTHFETDSLAGTADRIAKLIVHDIYLYGRADVEVLTDQEFCNMYQHEEESAPKTNLILVGDAHQNVATKLVLAERKGEVTIDTKQGSVVVGNQGAEIETVFQEPGTGLLMIRPWGSSNLAMVIAGLDAQGLEMASRLFPKRTGILVPDWIVAGPEMPWKGAGGVLAAGYWGNKWEYLPSMSA